MHVIYRHRRQSVKDGLSNCNPHIQSGRGRSRRSQSNPIQSNPIHYNSGIASNLSTIGESPLVRTARAQFQCLRALATGHLLNGTEVLDVHLSGRLCQRSEILINQKDRRPIKNANPTKVSANQNVSQSKYEPVKGYQPIKSTNQ